jgi:cell division protein FtsW
VVIALLAVLAYTGLRIARRVDDPFRRIVATGITAWLVGQATINIGGVIGLLPITGLPLPFISDGGSALVVVLGAVGVLASFARAEPDAARALHARPPDRWVRLLWAPLPPLPREGGEDAYYSDLRRKRGAGSPNGESKSRARASGSSESSRGSRKPVARGEPASSESGSRGAGSKGLASKGSASRGAATKGSVPRGAGSRSASRRSSTARNEADRRR